MHQNLLAGISALHNWFQGAVLRQEGIEKERDKGTERWNMALVAGGIDARPLT